MDDKPKPEFRLKKAPGTAATPQQALGGTVTPEYYNLVLPTITVPVAMLKTFMDSSKQEMIQFAIGGFIFSGTFWLAFERFLTVPDIRQDVLFISCVLGSIASAVPAYFGWRQMQARREQIQELLDGASKTTTN